MVNVSIIFLKRENNMIHLEKNLSFNKSTDHKNKITRSVNQITINNFLLLFYINYLDIFCIK